MQRVSRGEDRSDFQGQMRQHSNWIILQRKETELHQREQDGLRHCQQQARKFQRDLIERGEEHLEQDDELERAPKTRSKIFLVEMVRMTENGDD